MNNENNLNLESVSTNQEDNLTSQGNEDIGQQAEQNPTIQDEFDYTKDSRWGKMWKTDKDIYKSYKNLESVYEPIKNVKTDYDNLQKIFKDNNIDSTKLNDYIKEFNDLKNPSNPRNMIGDYVLNYFNNQEDRPLVEKYFTFLEKPEYRPYLNNFFNELQARENQKLYPGMTAEQINHIKQLEEKVSNFDNMFNQQKEQQKQQQIQQETAQKIQEIEAFANNLGLKLDVSMFENLGRFMYENGLNHKHSLMAFKELYNKEIQEALLNKQEQATLQKLNKNNKTVVPTANTQNKVSNYNKDMSVSDKIKNIWEEMTQKK